MKAGPSYLYIETLSLLHQIECELKHAQLWSQQRPSPDDLASKAPFCIDTMSLEAWLQYVFLPRMHQLVERQQPLPAQIAIAPMVEQSLSGSGSSVQGLLWAIRKLDQLLESQSL